MKTKASIFKTISFAASFAVTSASLANTIGNDFQRFNPTVGGIDYLTVEPSQTLPHGLIHYGAILDIATNTLPVFDSEETTQSFSSIQDTLISTHFYAGYGLMNNLEVGLNLPFILSQSSESGDSVRGEITSSGLSYMGISGKYTLVKNSKWGLAASTNLGVDMMKSNPYIGDTSPFYFSVLGAADTKIKKTKIALNLGYKHRTTGEAIIIEDLPEEEQAKLEGNAAPIEPYSGEFIYSIGANFDLGGKRTVIAELYGSAAMSTGEDLSDRSSNALELLGAYKQEIGRNMSITAGFGTDAIHGPGSADMRLFAGISMTMDGPKILASGRSSSNSRKSSPSRFNTSDDDIYGIPGTEEPVYEEPSYEPAQDPYENLEGERKPASDPYEIEETELPSFDDPYDYSLD